MQSAKELMVCLALSGWISKQLAAESAITKERRKAREERQLLPPPAGGRGGGQGSCAGRATKS
eukprot:5545664-Pyramimonas_sp.AAC.1